MQTQKRQNPSANTDYAQVLIGAVIGGMGGLAVEKALSGGQRIQSGGGVNPVVGFAFNSLLSVGGSLTILSMIGGGAYAEEIPPREEFGVFGDNFNFE